MKRPVVNPSTQPIRLMKATFSVLCFFCLPLLMQAQVPLLNSYPQARATIYLDFDGHYVQGTIWNWAGPINAEPALFNAAQITEIFNRVAEDYRIFNINITTDSTVYFAAPADQRVRIIITPTWKWYGSSGGVSFVGSFVWGNETPAWVFSERLGNSVKNVAEAISHEAGHTLGLQHQSVYDQTCVKQKEYSEGQGTGEIGWAPIMGSGYSRNLTTWHYGQNAEGCDVMQDDIAIIASYINDGGFRPDDHSDNHLQATPVNQSAIDFHAEGLINSASDKDVFAFTAHSSTNFRISAVPLSVGAHNEGANVDIKVSLLNHAGDTIGRYNPMELLNAGADSNINAGTYYLVVEGVGNPNLSDYGSLGHYSLYGSFAHVLPVHHISLTGSVRDSRHVLGWSFKADEPIKRIELEYAKDGKHYTTLAVSEAGARGFSWQPVDGSLAFYRLRIITVAEERSYYSKVITLPAMHDQQVKLQGSIITDKIQLYAAKDYTYNLYDESGRLMRTGRLITGANAIDGAGLSRGVFILRVQGINEVHTFRLVKP